MKIWGRANSINVMKVLWAADECGIAYERTDVGGAFGGNDQKWYLDMNPNGVVPTIDDGGRVIWESNSAVRYLSARYAAATLWPNDPGQRSEADRWMDWQLSTLSESMRVVFWGLVRTPPDKRDMAAINAPLQGGAADIIKRAMIRLPAALSTAKLKARMLLQVHDELLFEVPEKEIDKLGKVARTVMEGAASLSVPLVVDTGVGDDWATAH